MIASSALGDRWCGRGGPLLSEREHPGVGSVGLLTVLEQAPVVDVHDQNDVLASDPDPLTARVVGHGPEEFHSWNRGGHVVQGGAQFRWGRRLAQEVAD